MDRYSVQRLDQQIFFNGLLSIGAVEAISKQAQAAAEEKVGKLSIFIEANGGEDAIGAILCHRLLDLVKAKNFPEGLCTIAGQEVDSSCLTFFLAGTKRLIFRSSVFHFHPSRVFAVDENRLPAYVTLSEVERGLGMLRFGGKQWMNDGAIRSLLRKLPSSADNPIYDFLCHTSTLLDLGVDCASAGYLAQQYIEAVCNMMKIGSTYNVQMLQDRTNLSKSGAEALFLADRLVDAETAMSIGLAHGYI